MKRRIYVAPVTEPVPVEQLSSLMVKSPEGTRGVGGGPSEDEDFPTTVGETDGNTDPYSDNEGNKKGQGSGGGGNRAKVWDIWED